MQSIQTRQMTLTKQVEDKHVKEKDSTTNQKVKQKQIVTNDNQTTFIINKDQRNELKDRRMTIAHSEWNVVIPTERAGLKKTYLNTILN